MYQCYDTSCGHEDLTLKVEIEKRRPFDVLQYQTGRRHWKVSVPCSKGHWNTFEGDDDY